MVSDEGTSNVSHYYEVTANAATIASIAELCVEAFAGRMSGLDKVSQKTLALAYKTYPDHMRLNSAP